ncbi:uncharacterized protein (DUF2252 family) [Mesorhizobium soli]|uniref:DUF2252 domain-containing protein n=1 Tax=Pseudaminobacter soli (ex Li et al. 2025) TaxID=1295366 RepID=UPI0024753B32|nr:DUF2252 domain-containing protein [Mesorhizobium soli]MDH6230792.1 uncharacterized protein (DUF2252 family) [Mesorhizobium soli]
MTTWRDRTAAGKALRATIPRKQHALWNAEEARPDPVDLLQDSDAGRMRELIAIRYGRMLQSPFAFYRGAAGVMAADLARTPITGLKVQACGDCHLVNFGGFATPERNIIFDINDFDETLPAPWEWDVKRLVASIVLAARSNGLTDSHGRESAVNCARKYRLHMREFSSMDPLRVWYTETRSTDFLDSLPKHVRKHVRKRIEQTAAHSGSEFDFPKLAGSVGGQVRIIDQPPLIFHREATPDAVASLVQLFHRYKETLSDDRRILFGRYRLVDVAIKVVGVGSVGRRCWIALMMSEGNDPLFLQFKEVVGSVLEVYAGKSAYSHQGHRVVMGQRLMQPTSDIFLGWTTAADGRQYYVRQLHDAKIKPLIGAFDAEMLDAYAQACGWVLARAHAKASEASATISGYLGSSSDEFDTAMGKFAVAYADQTERDYAALKASVRQGKIVASETSHV